MHSVKPMTVPGFEPGLSRPQRDVLTARRYGQSLRDALRETLTGLIMMG